MIYIYDILLNFNEELIEFFEWEEFDNIKYVRKIPVFKVSEKTINDFARSKVKIDYSFLDTILNKSDLYDEDVKGYSNLFLITDGNIVLGINVVDDEIKGISRLLLDEEYEVLKLSNRISYVSIPYKIIGKIRGKNNKFTRYESMIVKELKDEFKRLYKNNMIEKLNYFYYEYFNECSNDKDKVYNSLLDSIDNNFNEKHLILYDLLRLSYKNNINI